MMVYKPKVKKSAYEEAPNGVGTVTLLKNRNIGVKFLEDNDNEFAGKKYKVTDWPNHVNPKNLPGRKWFVRLGNDKKSIFSISPQSGMFTGKVQSFASAEGQPPVPKTKDYTWEGRVISYRYFTVLIEIMDGDEACVGMLMPYVLRYNFDEDEEGNACYTHWGKNAVHTPKLHEFLSLVGAWDQGEVEWEDNILPTLQKRILKAGKTFKFVVKDGWIDTIYEDESFVGESEEESWEDESWDNEPDPETTSSTVDFEWDD